jgi:hypothetical protein
MDKVKTGEAGFFDCRRPVDIRIKQIQPGRLFVLGARAVGEIAIQRTHAIG